MADGSSLEQLARLSSALQAYEYAASFGYTHIYHHWVYSPSIQSCRLQFLPCLDVTPAMSHWWLQIQHDAVQYLLHESPGAAGLVPGRAAVRGAPGGEGGVSGRLVRLTISLYITSA